MEFKVQSKEIKSPLRIESGLNDFFTADYFSDASCALLFSNIS